MKLHFNYVTHSMAFDLTLKWISNKFSIILCFRSNSNSNSNPDDDTKQISEVGNLIAEPHNGTVHLNEEKTNSFISGVHCHLMRHQLLDELAKTKTKKKKPIVTMIDKFVTRKFETRSNLIHTYINFIFVRQIIVIRKVHCTVNSFVGSIFVVNCNRYGAFRSDPSAVSVFRTKTVSIRTENDEIRIS